MWFAEYLESELAALDAEGLLRVREPAPHGGPLIDVCTNDYLGHAARLVSRETLSRYGSGASRLIFGTQPEHLELERELAAWVGAEDALFFSSGFAANLGLITALARPGDLVVSDALNHASIVDGCRLSRATVEVVPHGDLRAVERALETPTRGRRWVVVESYYSMDANTPDLLALRSLCDERGAGLLVDEAHALGVFGPSGAGICRDRGVVPDAFMGGLGKAVGAQGAFLAGSRALTQYLWNRARSFVFTTAPSPLTAAAALDQVRAARSADEARARLAALSQRFEAALGPLAGQLPPGRHGPLFPLLLGAPGRAVSVADALRAHGFLAQAIRPPTVPPGQARIRIALHADLAPTDADRLAATLLELCRGS